MRRVDLTVHDVAFGGKGVARDNGKVIFIPYVIDGEEVSAEVVREKKQFAEAELVEIRERSPHRVQPECPYFGRCGGCAYQHIDYAHQLELKFRQVRDALRRIGKSADPPMRPIIPSPDFYGYRNRITVHVQDSVIGFFRRESNRLIDVERCPISTAEVNQELQKLRRNEPGEGHYTLRARNSPRIFTQTNSYVAERLRDVVAAFVPANQSLLIDAYCGAGFFAKALADRFDQIIGIDWDRFAIAVAKKSATANESYIAGNVEQELIALTQKGDFELARAAESGRSLVMIVDPPATGLTDAVRASIIELAPATFVYVSCNPATLARDLRQLTQTFRLQSVTPLDMFPQTAEIEVVAHLQA